MLDSEQPGISEQFCQTKMFTITKFDSIDKR